MVLEWPVFGSFRPVGRQILTGVSLQQRDEAARSVAQTDSAARYAIPYDDEIDLRELFMVLWRGRWTILVITLIFAAGSVFYALSQPNQYRAHALLVSADSGAGGMSGALSQFGGLASLAGVSLDSGGSNEGQIAQQIMQSQSLIEAFIARHGMSVAVMAGEGWDPASDQLTVNADIYDSKKQQWLIEDKLTGALRAPTSWELYEEFGERLSVSEDKKTSLVTVSIEFYSPKLAQRWVDEYIVSINEYMRNRKLQQVNSNIQYLEAQIAKTAIADMKEVFYQLVEEQIKTKMLAEATPEYAFTTVSRAMLPEEKSQPKRALICVLGTLLGGMLSVLWVLLQNYGFSGGRDESASLPSSLG